MNRVHVPFQAAIISPAAPRPRRSISLSRETFFQLSWALGLTAAFLLTAGLAP